jgi:hypothetical protein
MQAIDDRESEDRSPIFARAAMTSDMDMSDATLTTAQQGAFCSPLFREVRSESGS